MNKEEGLNINISAPNLISVCVDASDRGEFSGRLYQCYSQDGWYPLGCYQAYRLAF